MAEAHKYKAFISYSRKDRDSARRLQRELESYVLPKVVQIPGLDRRTLNRPLKPVFRDESELVPGQDLPERIRQGLAQSESLIVVCSPDAVRSEWVEKEIVDFTRLGKGRRILAVVVGGEPNAAARGVAAENEALPRALRFHVDVDGTIGSKPADPLWIDRRESVADRRQMFLRIVGALLGLQSLDDLILRERQAERRRRLVAQGIAAAMTVLAVLASGAGWIAYQRGNDAVYARDQTLEGEMRLLTQAAAERLKDGDVPGAQGIILEVLARRGAVAADRATAVNIFQEMRANDHLLLVLWGHSDRVNCAAYSPDGRRLVTGSFDNTARIWDAGTGVQLAVLSGHSDYVISAAWSPDGKHIVTASQDKTVRIWDAATGIQRAVLSGHGDVVASAQYSPDGKHIVTASVDKTARIWDAGTGAQLAVLSGHGNIVTSASYSPDGKRILTASYDKTARIWDAATGAQLVVLSGHGDSVECAAYSPDGKRIVTASDDKTVRIWDAARGTQLSLLTGHADAVTCAAWSPDGSRIVSASLDRTARIWDAATGAQLGSLSGYSDVFSAAYSPDGRRIVTVAQDKAARIWDAATGAQLAVLSGHGDHVVSAGWSPDGRRVITASSDKTARIWNAATWVQIAQLSGHHDRVESAAYSPDGQRIVTASDDKTVRIWDASTDAQLAVLSGHGAAVTSAAWSPDGRRIVSGSWDKTARIWNAATGAQIAVLSGHSESINSAAYSPDGRHILTASADKTARIWEAASGAQLVVLSGHGGGVIWAAYSLDGKYIVTASVDKTARIWDAATGAQLALLTGHGDHVVSAAFSPDGKRIVTASVDKTVRIWDAATGTQLAELLGHTAAVIAAVYSPDGRRVVSASDDDTARIWDARVPADLDAQIIWDQAAEFDPPAEVERAQLGLPPDARVRTWQKNVTKCDQMAAVPYDPDRDSQGVMQGSIVADVANSACAAETAKAGRAPRSVYELGRALEAKHDLAGARREFELAVSEGYPAAQIDLGDLLVQREAGMRDDRRAVSLYEQAWRDGVSIAAFELGHLFEHGVHGRGAASQPAVHSEASKAWDWYRKGADAGEPNALARFGEQDDRAAAVASDAKKRDALLLNAFQYYAAAAERAHDEDWPDDAWQNWRYRRATLARLLAREGMMRQVADAYAGIRDKWRPHSSTLLQRIKGWLRL